MDSKFCYFYHRFGQCRSGSHCPYVHDPTRVALCRAMLYKLPHDTDACPYNHTSTPYNTPLCQYFQEGKCTSSLCLFLHVKMADTAPICPSFRDGYCSNGFECTKKHVWVTKATSSGTSSASSTPTTSSSPAGHLPVSSSSSSTSSSVLSEGSDFLAFSSTDEEEEGEEVEEVKSFFGHKTQVCPDTSDFIHFCESDVE
ncbi:hypothetical protein HMI54_002299 [Coelomomyces lativittatus]|nr:hypothetical protein HMI54_002299 [Coelomomyces lativittatus]